MRLSLRGEYALRSLVVLGLIPKGEVLRIHSISEQQNIPRKFLEQILHEMKNAG
ncbi:MAG: Rrf2 family transcriptional regulator, partial [Verrucomicrobia bacterium]